MVPKDTSLFALYLTHIRCSYPKYTFINIKSIKCKSLFQSEQTRVEESQEVFDQKQTFDLRQVASTAAADSMCPDKTVTGRMTKRGYLHYKAYH